MTTEAKGKAVRTGSELRYALLSLLALSYLGSFWAFMPASTEPEVALEPASGLAPPQSPTGAVSVWYGDLPASARPSLDLPAGWELASADAALTADAPPRARRVIPARPMRVRTRSS